MKKFLFVSMVFLLVVFRLSEQNTNVWCLRQTWEI